MGLTSAGEADSAGFDVERLGRIDESFNRYAGEGVFPGWLVTISRRGKVAYISAGGLRDVEAGLPVELDTIWRIHSMSKPIAAFATMLLWERGLLELTDPISRWIPAFGEARVWKGGSSFDPKTVPAREPIRIWHLLTHTAGLTYASNHEHPVDEIFREIALDLDHPGDKDLGEACESWAKVPLLYEPGTGWSYGIASDVLGRVIEVVSGEQLDEFLQRAVFGPLGMTETGFVVKQESLGKLAALYRYSSRRNAVTREDAASDLAIQGQRLLSLGHGLVSTAADYRRFADCLLGGGNLEGVRVLGERTVSLMTRNHLPGGIDIPSFRKPAYGDVIPSGQGYGFGVSVCIDPIVSKTAISKGEYGWEGAAGTVFWVDPREQMTVCFFAQLLPPGGYSISSLLHQLIHQAIVD